MPLPRGTPVKLLAEGRGLETQTPVSNHTSRPMPSGRREEEEEEKESSALAFLALAAEASLDVEAAYLPV